MSFLCVYVHSGFQRDVSVLVKVHRYLSFTTNLHYKAFSTEMKKWLWLHVQPHPPTYLHHPLGCQCAYSQLQPPLNIRWAINIAEGGKHSFQHFTHDTEVRFQDIVELSEGSKMDLIKFF